MTIQEIIQAVQQLSNTERDELMSALQTLPDTTATSSQQYRLSDLRGVGAEIWREVDAQEYINELRDEWDND